MGKKIVSRTREATQEKFKSGTNHTGRYVVWNALQILKNVQKMREIKLRKDDSASSSVKEVADSSKSPSLPQNRSETPQRWISYCEVRSKQSATNCCASVAETYTSRLQPRTVSRRYALITLTEILSKHTSSHNEWTSECCKYFKLTWRPSQERPCP